MLKGMGSTSYFLSNSEESQTLPFTKSFSWSLPAGNHEKQSKSPAMDATIGKGAGVIITLLPVAF